MNRLLFSIVLLLVFTSSGCSQSNTKKSDNKKVSLETKIGQMLNIGFRGLQVADTNHIVRDIEQYHLGSIMLFDYDVPSHSSIRNISSPEQVKNLIADLQRIASIPLFISVDQEGEKIARLSAKNGFPRTVSEQYLGSLSNTDSSKFYARRIARTLSSAGFNVDLAPVVDVNVNPDNPVIGSLERSYSSNPKTVTRQAKIFINALHQYHILSVLKHFPGHGSSTKDSHLGVVDVTHTWSKKELVPFRALIKSHDADMIMTAHIFNAGIDSVYPATLSKATITGILRKQLDFKGVVMSDDLMMGAIRKEYSLKEAIRKSIQAGVDILSFANNSIYDPDIVPESVHIIKELINEGKISEQRINQSYKRIMKLKSRL